MDEITDLRQSMAIAACAIQLPDRFDSEPHGNEVTITDRQTGLAVTVGLCDYHGARQVLAALFPDERTDTAVTDDFAHAYARANAPGYPNEPATATIWPLELDDDDCDFALASVKDSIDGIDPNAEEDWLPALERVRDRLADRPDTDNSPCCGDKIRGNRCRQCDQHCPAVTVADYHDLVVLVNTLTPWTDDWPENAERRQPAEMLLTRVSAALAGNRACPVCAYDGLICYADDFAGHELARLLEALELTLDAIDDDQSQMYRPDFERVLAKVRFKVGRSKPAA